MALFTLHLCEKMSLGGICHSNRIRQAGNFPRKSYNFERRDEPAIKEAIKRLCNKETGYMAVVGQGGTGKSALVAKVLQLDDFLADECPSIQTVIWLNVLRFSAKKVDVTGFYLALAKLIGIRLRKPEGQNDKPLDEQIREALNSRRARPASILLVLDDVSSDELLPQLAKFQYIIRCIAITRFGATLGVHGDNCTYTPLVVNVAPLSDDECLQMVTELLPKGLFPQDKMTTLARLCAGVLLVGRLLCGHFFECTDPKVATARYDELVEKLTALRQTARNGSPKVLEIVTKLLEIHFEHDADMFAKYCAFLLFDEETSIEGEDLSFLWNVDVRDAVTFCEHQLRGKGMVQVVNFEGDGESGEGAHGNNEEEAMEVGDDATCPISLPHQRHCFTVHPIMYQAAADLQKKFRQNESVQLANIIREAGRKHPRAWLGENILHLAARIKRTALLRAIVNRADVDSLSSLCKEENAEKETPVKYLCAAYAGEWFIDSAPPMLVKATLPLMDKLSATPLIDNLIEQIVVSKFNVDRLLLLSCDIGYSFLAAKLIFNAKADVNAKKRRWPYYNCLMLAARKGHDAIVKLLLDNGADASVKDGHGRTALMLAVDAGHEAVVGMLLANRADLLEDGNVMPALMNALERKHESIAKVLLMKGAEQNIADESSERALILAARSCKEPIVVKFLLEKGVDPNAKDVLSRTALIQATQNGLEANVRLLLSFGAHPEIRDKGKETALMLAAQLGYDEIAKLLLEHNANANAKDRLDRTPLVLAIWKGHEAVASVLLEAGADPNIADSMGRTPLILAASLGQEAIVSLLLDKGASITARDKVFNKTPLVVAAENGHWTVVRLLMERGASPNESETFNRTNALILAVEKGHTAVVELLLQKGADPNSTNSFNATPLMAAAEFGHLGLVKLLLDRGADPTTKDINNRTALLLARNHNEITNILQPLLSAA